jgi:hypothetical protein
MNTGLNSRFRSISQSYRNTSKSGEGGHKIGHSLFGGCRDAGGVRSSFGSLLANRLRASALGRCRQRRRLEVVLLSLEDARARNTALGIDMGAESFAQFD